MNHNRIFFAWILAMLFIAGCAQKYSIRSVESPIALQWPYPPATPRLSYIHSIYGFGQGGSKNILRVIAGSSSNDKKDHFGLPVAVAKGVDGRMAVADTGCRCVHLYLPAQQKYLRLTKGDQQIIQSPVAVVFDAEQRLFLSDSSGTLFAFDSEGKFLFAKQQLGNNLLKRPTGLAYNPNRKLLYVVDTLANSVHAMDSSGNPVFSFGERGMEEGRFNYPTHCFWSREGQLYVTDSMNFRLQFFDDSGKFLGVIGNHGDGSGDMAMPKGVAADSSGVIYVVDALFDNVQLFNKEGNFLLSLGDRGTDFGQFWLPSGMFISDSNELYVCDTYNRRIQVFKIQLVESNER